MTKTELLEWLEVDDLAEFDDILIEQQIITKKKKTRNSKTTDK
jgi:hypothetical protein